MSERELQERMFALRMVVLIGMLLMMAIGVVSCGIALIATLFGANFMVAFTAGVGCYFTVYAGFAVLIWAARCSVRKQRMDVRQS